MYTVPMPNVWLEWLLIESKKGNDDDDVRPIADRTADKEVSSEARLV